MRDLEKKLTELTNLLEGAAFLVSKGEKEKEAHAEIIKSLVLLSDLKTSLLSSKIEANSMKKDSDEAAKVHRRLKLWAKRQTQINSKILNAYLLLERSGVKVITESDLKDALPDVSAFNLNFAQMKIIAPKNHGKIFEQSGALLTLWPPIESYVREYENTVFNCESESM